jgi:sulfonate transport system substrate-binding protein
LTPEGFGITLLTILPNRNIGKGRLTFKFPIFCVNSLQPTLRPDMDQTSFKIGGVPEHFNLPWYQAQEKGLFEAAGLQVTWTDYAGGTGAMAKDLRSGDLDVAVLLTEGIVADIVKGNPSRIIQVYVASPLLWGIHVPATSSFQSAEELAGKRYAVSRLGSGSHLMAFVDARQRGWDPADLELVLVGGLDGAREAFRNNLADAFMWEKFMTKPLVDAGEFRRVGETPTPWPCFVIAARNEVIEKKGEALKKLLTVINQASRDFQQAPADALPLITNRFHLQPEDAQTWFAATRWATGGPVSPAMIGEVMETLRDLHLIDSKPDPASLIQDFNS